ncbi:MAG: RNA methyltransferase [Bdellovibrionales bacterium]|nr:RNA methyltransferase [Bdellovibrionales bacterium]
MRSKIRKVIGIHSCKETLKVRPKKIRTIYIQRHWQKNPELKFIVEQARRFRIDFIEQTKEQMASWGKGHQGTALTVEESPIFKSSSKEKSILIFIDGLEDPRNLGSIVRTSWLMGADGIFLPIRNSIQQITPAVSKSASGGTEHIPIQFLSQPVLWMKKQKEKGYWLYGLDPKGSHSIWKESFNDKIILIAGSEGRGLKQTTKKLCDQLIYIPQKSSSGNYNLSVSLALALARTAYS